MSQEHEVIDEFASKKPTFIERCKHSFGSFFKDGIKGALVGLAVGAVVGASFAVFAPMFGIALAGSALAVTAKFAIASTLFGGALHATMGAIEAFAKTGSELDVEREKLIPAKQEEKSQAVGKIKEVEAHAHEQEPTTKFRDMVATRRAQPLQVEQRY